MGYHLHAVRPTARGCQMSWCVAAYMVKGLSTSSVSNVPTRQHLHSVSRRLLVILCYWLRTYSHWAFSVAGPTVWNSPSIICMTAHWQTSSVVLWKRFCFRHTSALTLWLIRANHRDQTWQAQFPTCCVRNVELSTATSLFVNHQPRSVPGWTQIPPVQVRLHMTLSLKTFEEWTNLLTYCMAVTTMHSTNWQLTYLLIQES